MLVKRLFDLGSSLFHKSHMYYSLGKDIYDYGVDLFQERFGSKKADEDIHISNTTFSDADVDELDATERMNLEKKFTVPYPNNPVERAHQQSMKASQGIPDHSGSGHKGPGKPGPQTNANMWQRNFENHQGN